MHNSNVDERMQNKLVQIWIKLWYIATIAQQQHCNYYSFQQAKYISFDVNTS